MEKYTDIVQFSRDLYLNFLPVFMRPHHLKKLDPPKYIRTAVKALHYFASCFFPKIQEVFAQHADQPIDTDEQFLKYAIPRCLKLIDEETFHFSFMLVATFIGLLQYDGRRDRRCLRFMLSGYKCLAAVYFRGFEEKFEHHGGWRGLRKYCEEVVRRVKSIGWPRRKVVFQELVGGGKESRVRMSEFIKNCDSVDDFELNERERIFLKYDDISETISEWWDESVVVKDDAPVKVKWTVRKLTYLVEMSMVLDTEMGVLEISVQRKKLINRSHNGKSSEVRMQYSLKSLLDAPIEPGTELKELVYPESSDGNTGWKDLGVKFLPCLVKRSVSTESEAASSIESSHDPNKCDNPETKIKCSENGIKSSVVNVKDAEKEMNLNSVVKNKITSIARVKLQPGGIEMSESRSGGAVSKQSKEKTETGFPDIKKDRPAVLHITETKQGEEKHHCLYNPTFLHTLQFFTDDVAEIEDFDSYDRKASARLCKRCGCRCYQYAKYLYKKHRDLALAPVMLRRTKARIIRSLSSIKTVFAS